MVSGLSQKDLDSIAEYKGVEVLFLQDCTKETNLDFLYSLNNLKDLTIDGLVVDLNLLKLSSLEKLSIDWGKWFNSIQGNTKIKQLSIWKCKEKDLGSLFAFLSLKELSITQSAVESLNGIEDFSSIESLTLALNKNLVDLTGLKNISLKKLIIEDAKKIVDYSFLSEMKNLEEIKIINCAPIDSISVIENLPNLKSCRVVGTKIADKDLSALNKLDDHYYG